MLLWWLNCPLHIKLNIPSLCFPAAILLYTLTVCSRISGFDGACACKAWPHPSMLPKVSATLQLLQSCCSNTQPLLGFYFLQCNPCTPSCQHPQHSSSTTANSLVMDAWHTRHLACAEHCLPHIETITCMHVYANAALASVVPAACMSHVVQSQHPCRCGMRRLQPNGENVALVGWHDMKEALLEAAGASWKHAGNIDHSKIEDLVEPQNLKWLHKRLVCCEVQHLQLVSQPFALYSRVVRSSHCLSATYTLPSTHTSANMQQTMGRRVGVNGTTRQAAQGAPAVSRKQRRSRISAVNVRAEKVGWREQAGCRCF